MNDHETDFTIDYKDFEAVAGLKYRSLNDASFSAARASILSNFAKVCVDAVKVVDSHMRKMRKPTP